MTRVVTVAASALLLAGILIGSGRDAHAYWDYSNATYAGTGKLLFSGSTPVDSVASYRFNNPLTVSGSYSTNGNPSFSIGDGSASSNIMGSLLRYGASSSGTTQVTIDTTATPSLPVVTISLTWVPNPQSDVNNDGFINSLDDPAPLTAPTATLSAQGNVSSTPGRGPNSMEAVSHIETSYKNALGNWVSAASVLVTNPLSPLNTNSYSVSDTQNATVYSSTYSGGVATYQIRFDTYVIRLDGATDTTGDANTSGAVDFTFNP
ncbi:MAG: hypothetical protein EOO88_42870 [Pedobacter sp.]|nr:MAG: hypothetical protein EOO88_42870 [Pedobacter sp.]